MNREEAKEKLDSRLTAYGQVHYGGDNIDDIVDELFDHIEALEAENKELKDIRNSTVLIGQDDVDFLQHENKTMFETIQVLEAKLEDIESSKVAEHKGVLEHDDNGDIDCLFIGGGGNHIEVYGLFTSELIVGETYKVTISKQKK